MAKTVFKDPHFTVNSVDLSDWVSQVSVDYSADTPEGTSSGDNTHGMLPNGLKNYTINVTFRQDFASGAVDATLFPLVGASAGDAVVRASQSALGGTNPSYTGAVVLQSYNPVSGGVGDTHDAGAVFVPDATATGADLTRATS